MMHMKKPQKEHEEMAVSTSKWNLRETKVFILKDFRNYKKEEKELM